MIAIDIAGVFLNQHIAIGRDRDTGRKPALDVRHILRGFPKRPFRDVGKAALFAGLEFENQRGIELTAKHGAMNTLAQRHIVGADVEKIASDRASDEGAKYVSGFAHVSKIPVSRCLPTIKLA